MNKELAHIIKLYSLDSHVNLHSYLMGKSKDTLISVLTDVITIYMNDKNSSTLREFLTITLAGYEHNEGKIGYNGYKQNSFISGKTIKCEAKPKNFTTSELDRFDNKKRKTPPSKLNGGGNFTDYSLLRLEKDLREPDLNMLVSGFVDGRLVYILEFPFGSSDFVKNLRMKLNRWQDKMKGSKSTTGQFLRSADFCYKDYIGAKDLKIVFLLNKQELEAYKQYIVRDFYSFLQSRCSDV